jgi:chaperonin GroES
MQTIQPAPNKLFIKPTKKEEKTQSGLILMDKSVDAPKTAEVINVGIGVSGYKQHDIIVYKTYATTELKLNGEDYMLVDEEDVMGVVMDIA